MKLLTQVRFDKAQGRLLAVLVVGHRVVLHRVVLAQLRRRRVVAEQAVLSLNRGDRVVLRRWTAVGRAHLAFDGRVLALVAGAPVGGRLLRGFRDRGDRVPVHPPRPRQRQAGDHCRAVRDDHLHGRRRARQAPPPLFRQDLDCGAGVWRQLLGARRWTCLAGAVLVFGYIYTVARARSPLGLLA